MAGSKPPRRTSQFTCVIVAGEWFRVLPGSRFRACRTGGIRWNGHRAGHHSGGNATAGWAHRPFDLISIRHATRHRDVCLTFGYDAAVFNTVQRLRRIPNVVNMDGIEWSRARWGPTRQAILWTNERIACWVGNELIADHPAIAKYLAGRANPPVRSPPSPTARTPSLRPQLRSVTSRGLEPGRYLTLICSADPGEFNTRARSKGSLGFQRRGYRLAVLRRPHPQTTDPYHRQVMDAASAEVQLPGRGLRPRLRWLALRFHSRSAYLPRAYGRRHQSFTCRGYGGRQCGCWPTTMNTTGGLRRTARCFTTSAGCGAKRIG